MPDIIDANEDGNLTSGGDESAGNESAEDDTQTVYFDATLSKLSYGGSARGGSGLPTDSAGACDTCKASRAVKI